MVLVTGGAYGALIGATAMAFYDPSRRGPASQAALYRDFLVSVDVGDRPTLDQVRRSLASVGGELVPTA